MVDSVTLSRAELSAAIKVVAKVAPWQRPTNVDGRQGIRPPAIRIDVEGGTAAIRSANFDRSACAVIAADGPNTSFTLPLQSFAAAIDKAIGERVDLTPIVGGAALQSGRLRASLLADPMDVVSGPAVTGDASVVPARALRDGLDPTESASSDDQKQPWLGGVYMHATATGMAFAAMDGNRIHARNMDGNRIHARNMDGNRIHARAILPDVLVSLLLATLPEEGDVTIVTNGKAISFEFDGVLISSQLLTGQFPGYADQLGAATSRVLRGKASEIVADLELVSTVADFKDRDVRLDLGAECIASSFRSGDGGYADGEVRMLAAFEGQPLSIGFQFRLVRDALAPFGDRPIEWRMGEPSDPTIVTSPDAPGMQMLLSPCLLKFNRHLKEVA